MILQLNPSVTNISIVLVLNKVTLQSVHWYSAYMLQGYIQSSKRQDNTIEKKANLFIEGKMLWLRWFDKCAVSVLSKKHIAVESKVKDNYLGQPVITPVVIQEYYLKMGSVDHSDHFLANYQTLKSIK